MAMKFRAHDTFFIRKGWLSKGMKYVHNRADVFVSRDENPTDVLGIGTNMVKALRYWLQAVGVTQEPVTGRRVQTFTELGNQIYEHDRYIEELGTLQLLHYKLASNKEEATAWYFFFNEFKMTEFTREDFVSALQSYAKPVSMRDIIALDEDDVVAIASRDLIDTHPLFARDRLLDSRTKAIPENNGKAFTTIITFYECNLEILWILLKDMDVLNSEGTKTKGKGKIKEFIRKRPNDETIHQFEELCGAFWNALIERFEDIYTYAAAEPNAQPYRNRAGGNLLFRPVALLPFVRAAVKVSIQQKKDFDEIFGDFPQELLYIDNIIWRNTLWNSDKGTMIVNNQKLTERILLYYWDRSTLTAKEISTMKLEIKSNLQLADMEDVETLLADAIDK